MQPRRHLNLTDDDVPAQTHYSADAKAAGWRDVPDKPQPAPAMVFVFGSNECGRHGLGAAQDAYKHEGAVLGVGVGHRGNSYAIPTKDCRMHRGRLSVGHTLPLAKVKEYVDEFLRYAVSHPELTFKVTQIGCGHAGLNAEDVAPLFSAASTNCFFDLAWSQYLPGCKFWGTF